MKALKTQEILLGMLKKYAVLGCIMVASGAPFAPLKAQEAMIGFGMGQNFSSREFYYRGTGSLFSTKSMWGAYQAFEFRPPQELGGLHFKLPTGIYAKIAGPLYLHYGLDAITSIALNDKVRHDLGLSLKFSGVQLLVKYAGPNGWAAQLAVPIK
jgi:hypothetical protein